VAWGAYSMLGRGAGDPLASNAAAFAWGVPLALATQVLGARSAPLHFSPAGLALAVASGALASGLGYVAWYAALRGLSPAQAAVVQLSVPPLAAAGAVLFLHETVGVRLVVCGALILGGIGIALRSQPLEAEAPARG
jgi:drug/metabolite transporter (DMT)-like permease